MRFSRRSDAVSATGLRENGPPVATPADSGPPDEDAADEPVVGAIDDQAEQPVASRAAPRRFAGRTRLAILVGCGAVTVVSAAILFLSLRGDDPPPDQGLDAWAPYWALDVSQPELTDRADVLRDLSPFWFGAERADSIVVDENASKEATDAFLASARRAGLRLVPSIVDAMPAGGMAAVLADPGQRAIHVDTLAEFAASGDFAGLDIDYEKFAFADDRSTWAETRPSWVAFITELAERLHADGRTLTVSIPPVYDDGRTSDSGYWVYDYAAIAPLVDRIRVMAYDYSTDSPGPIAPLDWVQQAIEGTSSASGDPAKLVLGLPFYGYNWVVSTTGTCPDTEDEGRTGVTARSARDLATRRGAEPVYDATTGEWTFTYRLELSDGTTACTQTRQVHYVDSEGALARLDLAEAAGFAGGSLWALGYEDEALWPGLAGANDPSGA